VCPECRDQRLNPEIGRPETPAKKTDKPSRSLQGRTPGFTPQLHNDLLKKRTRIRELMNRLKTTLFLTALTLILVAMGNAIGGSGGMAFALVLAAAMNFATYWYSDKLVLRMYWAREYLADETGARICRDPRPLAGALQRLHNAARVRPMAEATPATAHVFIVPPLTGGALMNLFSTHPPLEERVARLETLGRGRS
jgi:Zn-dependent protease with chaperone function